MYDRNNFSNPSFAITTPTLLTKASRDCPEDCQIVEFLTVANYNYFQELREGDRKAYNQKKQEILDSILDVVEKNDFYHKSQIITTICTTLIHQIFYINLKRDQHETY